MGKESTFILDFFNTVGEIKKAFEPFYTSTSLSEPTDVNVLHELKESLDEFGIYEQNEIDDFNEGFFNRVEFDQLTPILQVAARRFNQELDLSDEEKIDFKVKAKQFVKIYGQVACLISFNLIRWEKLYWFLKFLIPDLIVRTPDQEKLDELLDSIDLSTYGLERVHKDYRIGLDPTDAFLEPQNPNPRGYHADEQQKDPLDEIIIVFNERFFDGWDSTPEEQRTKFINIAKHVVTNPNYHNRVLDNQDEQNRTLALKQIINQAVKKERRRDLDLYKLYASDSEFQTAFNNSISGLLTRLDIREMSDIESLLQQRATVPAAPQSIYSRRQRQLAKVAERSVTYLERQLEGKEKWSRINQAIWQTFSLNEQRALTLSDVNRIAALENCTTDEVLSVLSILDRPSESLLEMQYVLVNSEQRTEMSLEEVTSQIRSWWKDKHLTDQDWQNWASNVLVQWTPVIDEEAI